MTSTNGDLQKFYQTLEGVCLDSHRKKRCFSGEVIYCEGKSESQLIDIAQHCNTSKQDFFGTRISEDHAQALLKLHPHASHHSVGRTLTIKNSEAPATTPQGMVAVISAGASDAAVLHEAEQTLRFTGSATTVITDVGVAGLHRLLAHVKTLQQANVIIVIAGMDGALPSVVAGLVDTPVIAVPTSVGYGASFQGIAPLLTMLNSCAAGVSVVNIDNGFGAGYQASTINLKIAEAKRS